MGSILQTYEWSGRQDPQEGALALRWHQVVRPCPVEPVSGVVFLGFASDEGVRRNQGREGAAEGPACLRRQLANLPVKKIRDLYEGGDIGPTDGDLESAQTRYAGEVAARLSQGLMPIGLGGGHEIAFGSFLGLADALGRQGPAPRIGILNLDAHFDLRPGPRATSGTPFWQIAQTCLARNLPFHYACLGISPFANTEALFAQAREWRVRHLLDEDMGQGDLPAILRFLTAFQETVDHLYLTICLDVLPASVAPGVSAPSARGVSLEVLEKVIDAVCLTGKVRLGDLAELNPALDQDGRTARVAARLIGRIVEGCHSSTAQ